MHQGSESAPCVLPQAAPFFFRSTACAKMHRRTPKTRQKGAFLRTSRHSRVLASPALVLAPNLALSKTQRGGAPEQWFVMPPRAQLWQRVSEGRLRGALVPKIGVEICQGTKRAPLTLQMDPRQGCVCGGITFHSLQNSARAGIHAHHCPKNARVFICSDASPF